ncbi:HicB-like antitoxin of toxin-antitoxin system domain-containing protein [Williamsia muralis]|uniref:helix-turn-helix domain-containing protein n=1 Tax=Williamsia marianensis TaxID=85044 RepID=UPI0039EBB2A8
MSTQQITAQLTRDGRFWLVHVPEIDQYTQARSVREAPDMARDLTAVWLDIPIENVEFTGLTIELPDDVRTDIEHAAELREAAVKANQESAAAVRAAALKLRDNGLTVRDIGAALDVSYQRAHQLISN